MRTGADSTGSRYFSFRRDECVDTTARARAAGARNEKVSFVLY